MTPSHRLKLYRSDEHLKELKDILEPLRGRREYPVTESMQPQRKGPLWVYQLDLSSITLPEMFPIIFGDYLFNVRSALDHLVVALAPRKRKSKASFPICITDPLATDQATGDYLDTEAATGWLSRTQGLPNDCVAAITRLQPHDAATHHHMPARTHPLAILSAFQNADKHRELVPVVTGLAKAQVTYDGQPQGVVPTLKDRAILDRQPTQVDVKIEGTAVVGISRGKTVWDLDQFTYNLNTFVANEVLPRLEQFLK
jgi:hypothetical protein